MSYKVILAVVNGYAGDTAVLESARTLATRFGAHVDVIHVRSDPYALPYLDAGVTPSVTASLLATIDAQIQTRRDAAWLSFCRWRDAAKLVEAEPPSPDPMRPPTIRWIERKGNEGEIAAQGCFADLIVLGQPSREQENVTTAFLAGAFESALFGTPRPVLVVPAACDGRSLLTGPTAIAWNGSLEANRALGAALPFLAQTGSAVVFIGEEPGRRVPDVAGLKNYLSRHGIDARIVEATVKGSEVGSYILKGVRDTGAGALVMGAYTHSRLREFVMGGATNHVSAHASTPVLMAH